MTATITHPRLATAAVETVRLGSAGLSASYYAMLGLAVHPAAAAGLGLVAGAADYVKGNALSVALDGRGALRRLLALIVFAILFIASMIAVDGVLLSLRAMWTAGPANVISAHERASAAHAAASAELARMSAVRTPDAIRADMDAAPVARAVFRRTRECTDITRDESLAACQPLSALRKEMADAIRKRELEAARDAAAATLAALGPRPAAADPQADAIASVSGLPPTLVAYLLIAVVGFALETVACFGLYVLGRKPAQEIRQPLPATVAKRLPAPQSLAFDHPVLAALATVAAPVSNRQLAAMMACSEGEATRRRQEVAQHLSVWQEGRELRIALNR